MSTSEAPGPLGGRHRLRPAKTPVFTVTGPCRHNPDRTEDECGLCSTERADRSEAVLRSSLDAEPESTWMKGWWAVGLAFALSALGVVACLYGTIRAIASAWVG